MRAYVDVDGVVNAGYSSWGGLILDGRASPGDDDTHTYKIKWAPELVVALQNLHDMGVEIVWLTTWRSGAQNAIQPLIGLDAPTRVLHPLSGRTTFPSIHWKIKALEQDQKESPSPFVWFDDEVGYYEQEVAEALGGFAPHVDFNTGISARNIEQTIEYFEEKKREPIVEGS